MLPVNEVETMKYTNYHTHTPRCQHARGSEEEYVKAAIGNGYAVMGFADHSPWPYKSDYVSYMRMRLSEFDSYEKTVRALGEKYKEQISVPLGLECEAFPEYYGWLRDFKAEHLDYVILGNHYDYSDEFNPDNGLPIDSPHGFYFGHAATARESYRYAERTIDGMKQEGLYDYLAHPDLFLFAYPTFDKDAEMISRDILSAAEETGLPIEYNLNGALRSEGGRVPGQGYPCRRFWEIASEYKIKAIVGLDAHQPEAISRTDLYEKAYKEFEELKIPYITEIPLKK